LSDAGAADGSRRAQHGAGAELRDGPAATAGAGTNSKCQHSPERYTALLPGQGVFACDGTECHVAGEKMVVYFLHLNPCLSRVCVQVTQSQSAAEGSSVLSELQKLREQLEKSEEERKALETQLREANSTVTQLQEEGSCPSSEIRLSKTCFMSLTAEC